MSTGSDFPTDPLNRVNRTLGPLYNETGYRGEDRVCFPRSDEKDLCAYNVTFFRVTEYNGEVSTKDGLLGLAPHD